MNIIGIVILSTIIVSYLLDLFADILNLKNLGKEVPLEFRDTIDGAKYLKSQNYTKENTYFGFAESIFGLSITLLFWFLGGFAWLDSIVRANIQNEVIRGIVFISTLLIANSILSMPFGIYSTFVIEEKYGFNKTTVKTYILDILKSTSLSALIGIPVLSLILFVLAIAVNGLSSTYGDLFWFYH